MEKPRIGLLPFYLKLYDDKMPERRAKFEPFLRTVTEGLEARGLEVVRGDICRVKPEFERALAEFRRKDVDCLVTLHLAYSPSMESIDAVNRSGLPVVILDTTMDSSFGPDVDADRIMYNHGIHGVMDFASMLQRDDKTFEIAAGHITESDVLDRAVLAVRGAFAARCLSRSRAMLLGSAFEGMGDFSVEHELMERALGVVVEKRGLEELEKAVVGVEKEQVDAEVARDREQFNCDLPDSIHRTSVAVGLGLRGMLEQGAYDAFSMNFMQFDSADGPVCTVPFLEASKAMARGIGYAGEGDVLTASLVGALSRAFGRTTFTEIFCPDWRGNSLFLSHMGEINPELSAAQPALLEKPFPFTGASNPAFVACAPAPGPAVFVNLAPGPGGSFTLIVAPVEVLGDANSEELRKGVRGWIRPACGVEDFLEAYSLNGGTHHSALVLGTRVEAIETFAAFSDLPCVTIV